MKNIYKIIRHVAGYFVVLCICHSIVSFCDAQSIIVKDSEMGLGFFDPNFYEHQTIFFYGNINLEKSISDHTPTDSMTFRRNKYSQFEIATAPPWLVPECMKMDYDRLYFRIISVHEDFVEIVVNAYNGQTGYLAKRAGTVVYWPDFLLSVNSVEFGEGVVHSIKVKPLDHASEVNTSHEYMMPLMIQENWLMVLLKDKDLRTVGRGWIRWKKNNKLLLTYSLFS